MKIKQLNKWLAQMDVLCRVSIDYKTLMLTLQFECHDGGHYEDVSLFISFESPYSYHFPFWMNAKFKVEFITFESEIEQIVPNETYEPGHNLLRLWVGNNPSVFYCYFDDLDWHLESSTQVLDKNDFSLNV